MVARKENSAQVNAAMVRRRFAELDKGNFTILNELFDSGYVLHFPGIPRPLSLAATKRFYGMLYAAFPDLRHTVVEQISARNKVVTRWTARGTHRAEWMGIDPTGKRVTFGGINIYTVRRGRLAESHVNWDILGLAQQLGATALRLQFGGKRTGAAAAR
jgi:predicted ester cyclase